MCNALQCRNVDVAEHARVWLGVQVVGRPVVAAVVTFHHSSTLVSAVVTGFAVVRLVT